MGSLACPLCCHSTFRSRKDLYAHLSDISDRLQKMTCYQCNEDFTLPTFLSHLEIECCDPEGRPFLSNKYIHFVDINDLKRNSVENVMLSDKLTGKISIVDQHATNCQSYSTEMINLVSLKRKLSNNFITINLKKVQDLFEEEIRRDEFDVAESIEINTNEDEEDHESNSAEEETEHYEDEWEVQSDCLKEGEKNQVHSNEAFDNNEGFPSKADTTHSLNSVTVNVGSLNTDAPNSNEVSNIDEAHNLETIKVTNNNIPNIEPTVFEIVTTDTEYINVSHSDIVNTDAIVTTTVPNSNDSVTNGSYFSGIMATSSPKETLCVTINNKENSPSHSNHSILSNVIEEEKINTSCPSTKNTSNKTLTYKIPATPLQNPKIIRNTFDLFAHQITPPSPKTLPCSIQKNTLSTSSSATSIKQTKKRGRKPNVEKTKQYKNRSKLQALIDELSSKENHSEIESQTFSESTQTLALYPSNDGMNITSTENSTSEFNNSNDASSCTENTNANNSAIEISIKEETVKTVNQNSETNNGKPIIFQCIRCKKLHSSREEFDKHKCDLVCDICHVIRKNHASLSRHKLFHKREKLEQMINEPSEETYSCEECGKTICINLKLTHQHIHKGLKVYECSACPHIYFTVNSLMKHLKIHGDIKNFNCNVCAKACRTICHLRDHELSHLSVKRFKCSYCEKSFNRWHEITKHERIHTGEKPKVCHICGKTFRVQYSLQVHMRVHTNERPYECELCLKRFKSNAVYKHHLKIHAGLKTYPCPHCPKAYSTTVALHGHVQGHIKPFKCEMCDRSFASRYALTKHIKDLHQVPNSEKDKFSCVICGAVYGRGYSLEVHLKTHEKLSKMKDPDIVKKMVEMGSAYAENSPKTQRGSTKRKRSPRKKTEITRRRKRKETSSDSEEA